MAIFFIQELNSKGLYVSSPKKKENRFLGFTSTLVPEVFLDFSWRKRSTASREAATTSRVSDEEREKNLWLP